MIEVPKGYRMNAPVNCPPNVYDLMNKCWEHYPKDRPSFKEILTILNKILNEVDTIYLDASDVSDYQQF